MASEEEDWDLRIRDGITGPADAITSALDDLEARAKGAKDSIADFDKAVDKAKGRAKEAADAESQMADETDKAGDKAKEAGSSMGEFAAGVGAVVTNVGNAVDALTGFGKAVFDKAIEPAVEAHDHIEKLHAQLNALGGSKMMGEGVLETLDAMRDKVGMTRDELAPMAEQLLAIKTPAKDFRATMDALAAQKALGLGGEGAVIGVLTKVSEHLKISNKELKALARDAGISGEEIAARMGVPLDKFRQQLKTGQLDTEKFRRAIVELSKEKGTEAAEAQAKSFDYTVKKLKEDFMDSFANMDTGPLIATMKELGQDAVELAPELAKIVQEGLNIAHNLAPAFKAVGNAIAWPIRQVSQLIDVLHELDDVQNHDKKMAADMAHVDQQRQQYDNAVKLNNALHQQVGTLKMLGVDQARIAEVREKDAQAVKASLQASGEKDIAGKMKEWGWGDTKASGEAQADQAAQAAKQQAGKGGEEAGSAAADGMADGMAAGEAKVRAGGAKLGDAAKEGMAGSLDAHSPSREAMKFGMWTGEGYTAGVDKSASEARAAVVEMVAPSNWNMPSFPASQHGSAQAQRAVNFNNCTFGGDLTETEFRRQVHIAFEEAARAA